MANKRYRNVGSSPVVVEGEDKEPGSEFMADFSPEQEKFLIGIGALEVIAPPPPSSKMLKASLSKGEDS